MGFRGDFPTQSSNSAQSMGYRSGVVVAFNKVTLENVISVGGADLVNLPILGIAEAATLEPGDVVGIMVVGSTWAILGQLVTPGTAEATDAITQLGSRVQAATVATNESTTSFTYVDLVTVGPSVTANVGASGKLLIMVGCLTGNTDTNESSGGLMSFELTGANTLAAATARAATLFANLELGTGFTVSGSVMQAYVLTGLNPGSTTVTAKYAVWTSVATEFQNRTITVFAL